MNDVIVNSGKFQAMIMGCDKKENKHDLNINNSIISSVDSVALLSIVIDNKLNFEKYISTVFKKARRELNAISFRIQRYICKKENNKFLIMLLYTLTLCIAH